MSVNQAATATAEADRNQLASELRRRIASNSVLDDPESLDLFGQDVSGDAHPIALVVRPENTEALVEVVKFANEQNLALAPRGGGMSYSGGYVCKHDGVVCVDTSGMNRVLEVTTEDMYVTVEAGCNWHHLHQTLEPLGVRTAF